MSKVLPVLLLLAMLVHIIRPLGLPGLRHRRDFWKIAVIAIAVMMLTVLIRPGGCGVFYPPEGEDTKSRFSRRLSLRFCW